MPVRRGSKSVCRPLAILSVLVWLTPPADARPEEEGDDPTPYVRLEINAHTAPVNAIAFSPDSQRLYTAGDDKAVHVWRRLADDSAWVSDRRFRWEAGNNLAGNIQALAVAQQAGHIAVGGFGNRGKRGEIVWLNPLDGSYFAHFFPKDPDDQGWQAKQHVQAVSAAAFSPDGNWFASSDREGRVLLWSGEKQAQAGPLPPPLHELYAPDMARLGAAASRVPRRPVSFVGSHSLVFPQLLTVRNQIPKWQLVRARLDAANPNAQPELQPLPGEYDNLITALAGSPNGRYLAAAAPGQFALYDFEAAGQPQRLVLENKLAGFDDTIYSLAFSPNGQHMAVGRERVVSVDDRSARLGTIELRTPDQPRQATWREETNFPVMACAFSPDNGHLAFVSGTGNDVSIARVQDGAIRAVRSLPGGDQIEEVAFADDTSRDAKRYRLFFRTRRIKDKPAQWFVFDPSRRGDKRLRGLRDSKRPADLFAASSSWSAARGRQPNQLELYENNRLHRTIDVKELQGEEITFYCWISEKDRPDGPPNAIAIATAPSNLIFVYDVRGGGLRRVYRGHDARILALNVSPDQQYLVSGAADGMVSIWKVDEFRSKWGVVVDPANGRTIAKLDELGPAYRRGLRNGDLLEKIEWFEDEGSRSVRRRQSAPAAILQELQRSPFTRQILFYVERGGQPVVTQTMPAWYPILSLYTRDHEWIAWAPTGHYDASIQGERLIGWQFNGRLGEPPSFATAQEYYKTYHRPQLIQELLQTADLVSAAHKVQITELQTVSAQQAPVTVIVVGADLAGKVIEPAEDSYEIVARITPPEGAKLLPVSLLRDGQLYETEPEPLRVGGRKFIDKKWTVKPDDRLAHRFSVLVDATPSRNSIRLRWPSFFDVNDKVLYVLAIGISEYLPEVKDRENVGNLDSPAADAQAIVDLFNTHYANHYDVVATPVLLTIGEETHAVNIAKAFSNFMQQPDGNDTAVFYYAGHGKRDNDGFCFIAADGRSDELTARKLLRDFCKKEKFRKLVILDTCHSGAAVADIEELARTSVRGSWGANFFASSAPEQPAYESQKGGLFTSLVIAGLKGEAWFKKQEDLIDAGDLAHYLYNVNRITIGKQRPVIVMDGEDKDPDWEPLKLTKPDDYYLKRRTSNTTGPAWPSPRWSQSPVNRRSSSDDT
jgi:WD40 repeat protein